MFDSYENKYWRRLLEMWWRGNIPTGWNGWLKWNAWNTHGQRIPIRQWNGQMIWSFLIIKHLYKYLYYARMCYVWWCVRRNGRPLSQSTTFFFFCCFAVSRLFYFIYLLFVSLSSLAWYILVVRTSPFDYSCMSRKWAYLILLYGNKSIFIAPCMVRNDSLILFVYERERWRSQRCNLRQSRTDKYTKHMSIPIQSHSQCMCACDLADH